jgi:hypothetical protein
MGVERLESRVNLSAASLVPAIPSTSGAGSDSLVVSPAAVPASPQVSVLTTSSAAVVAALSARNRVWSASIDVVVPSLPDATSLRLQATGGLTSWNGRQTPKFVPARADVQLDLSLGGQTVAVRAGQAQPSGSRALALAAAATNRVAATIRVDGKPGAASATGWYAVPAKVVAPNGGPSTPVTLLFSIGTVPAGSRAAAIRAVGGVGVTPSAVTVGVTLATPPVVAPISVAPAPVAVRVSAPSTTPPSEPPVVMSTPPYVLPAAVGGIVEVSKSITSDTTFRAGTVYVITGEVHVLRTVKLTIEDGVEVRIRNGQGRFLFLTSPALIFDSGSRLVAHKVTFQAANDANEPVNVANNGGVFFCGSTRAATKDSISSRIDPLHPSSFSADCIVANYLGRRDPRGGDGNGNSRDDIDAVSVIGVVESEWRVKAVEISHSGDDGFDLTDARILMESVMVYAPTEDGLNLNSSVLTITKTLRVDMTLSEIWDRELFDFEADSGLTSSIGIKQGATVDLHGYWDNRRSDDWIDLRSADMDPAPPDGIRKRYDWSGPLDHSPAQIYARERRF